MRVLFSRRSVVALVAILALTYLGHKGADVAQYIASVSIAIAGANALQQFNSNKKGQQDG